MPDDTKYRDTDIRDVINHRQLMQLETVSISEPMQSRQHAQNP